jgi:hypothetical protein
MFSLNNFCNRGETWEAGSTQEIQWSYSVSPRDLSKDRTLEGRDLKSHDHQFSRDKQGFF